MHPAFYILIPMIIAMVLTIYFFAKGGDVPDVAMLSFVAMAGVAMSMGVHIVQEQREWQGKMTQLVTQQDQERSSWQEAVAPLVQYTFSDMEQEKIEPRHVQASLHMYYGAASLAPYLF